MRYIHARTSAARSRRCRRGVALRWSRRPPSGVRTGRRTRLGVRRRRAERAPPAAVLVAAGVGAEVHALGAINQRDGAVREHERAADRIADHRDAAIRNPARGRCARCRLNDAVEHPPECPRDDDREDDEEEQAYHYAPGFRSPAGATDGCADCTLSSARFAAWPSGLSGASFNTSCHAFTAPSRSCFPNALTMPTLSSVFACFGSSFSERSNCFSALSGWLE